MWTLKQTSTRTLAANKKTPQSVYFLYRIHEFKSTDTPTHGPGDKNEDKGVQPLHEKMRLGMVIWMQIGILKVQIPGFDSTEPTRIKTFEGKKPVRPLSP